MPAKIVLSVYLDVEKESDEVSAMVSNLIGELSGNIESKLIKKRKRRPMTDEEKAAFRARMVAGKEAKAKAEEDADIDAKAEVDMVKKTAMVGSKPLEKKASAKAKPITGRKGERKPSTKE